MATTYTTKAKLRKPALADRLWGTPLNENADVLEAVNAVGALAVTLKEIPSASLNIAVGGGPYLTSWGKVQTYAGTASQACTASATNYVYLSSAGTLTVNTTGFPTAAAYIPLATVVAGATTITSVTDERTPIRMTIPNAQPTLGAATAGASYGATEQTMLQKVYDLARTLGLGT